VIQSSVIGGAWPVERSCRADPPTSSLRWKATAPGQPLATSLAVQHCLAAAAGVPVIRLHSVRHSLAFWMHHEGVTPADAAALLGHTVEVHLSTYLPYSGTSGIAAAAHALRQATRP
jgi:integrase